MLFWNKGCCSFLIIQTWMLYKVMLFVICSDWFLPIQMWEKIFNPRGKGSITYNKTITSTSSCHPGSTWFSGVAKVHNAADSYCKTSSIDLSTKDSSSYAYVTEWYEKVCKTLYFSPFWLLPLAISNELSSCYAIRRFESILILPFCLKILQRTVVVTNDKSPQKRLQAILKDKPK